MSTGSLAETVAAAVVEATLALLVATAVIATLASAGAVVERVRGTADLVRFELVLVDASMRVLITPDARDRTASARGAVALIPAASARRFETGFLDGEPERRIVVFDDGGVRVEVAGITHRFPSLRIERMVLEHEPVPHLALTVRAGTSEVHEVRAPFGLLPPP